MPTTMLWINEILDFNNNFYEPIKYEYGIDENGCIYIGSRKELTQEEKFKKSYMEL